MESGPMEEMNCMMMEDIQDSPSSMEPLHIAGSVNRFKNAGATYEYTERQYYCTGQVSTDYNENVRAKPSKFWLDALEYLLSYFRKPNQLRPHFLSPNFLDASAQIIDTLFIISFMDLPFQKAKPELTPQGDHSLKITPEKNLLLFLRSLKESGSEKVDLEILLNQKFVDPENMYEYSEVTKQNTIKKVEEFVRGKKYCGRVAITNSSESHWDIRVIMEIPQGAIPISPNEYSKSHYVRINPLSAQIVSYYFYFPQEGEFSTFRPIATMNGKLVASATGPMSVKVCEKFETKNVTSIEDILNTGSKADILKFLEDRNIHDPNVFQVSKIYWLMADPTFFKQAFAILERRCFYDDTVWKFPLLFGLTEPLKVLMCRTKFTDYVRQGNRTIGLPYFKSKLVDFDTFSLKDYNPLINPRAHTIGKSSQKVILNKSLKKTYDEFLTYLTWKVYPEAHDYLTLVFYLLLQDRIDEAFKVFNDKIQTVPFSGEIYSVQHDYLKAYLNCRIGAEIKQTKELCMKYIAYPVLFWRNMFVDIANQLSELEQGDGAGDSDKAEIAELENQNATKDNLLSASDEEYLEASLLNPSKIFIRKKKMRGKVLSN